MPEGALLAVVGLETFCIYDITPWACLGVVGDPSGLGLGHRKERNVKPHLSGQLGPRCQVTAADI